MENATKKVTVAQNFANVKAFLEQNGATEEMIAFIVDRAEKAQRKSSSSGKPTAKQIENEVLKDKLAEYLVGAEPMTVTQIINYVPFLAGLSTQKVSPLLADPRFKKDKVGKSMLYSRVVAEVSAEPIAE